MNFVNKVTILIVSILLIAKIETIDAAKYDEEASIYLKYTNEKRYKRSENAIENFTTTEVAPHENTTEECVGQKEFCNLSREEYITMLNDYIYPHTYEWVLIGTHTLVFITGLVGNALVCVAVYRNHSMRTVTNYFIVNLAVADFMVILFCLPATVLWDVTETWFLGDVLCKMLLYFQEIMPGVLR
ncbi:hypothetical protein HF086_008798 [Spodoptera exigua]|uniref:G-protein coupled receptors family 1 profile domain-containing protein n=1 Tax=Spodoptera exigua TaxID=7107 RepID=A0A922SP11_SPOEX|nr:hypothetical protein HF086_008798 [Spodoptera exigua]